MYALFSLASGLIKQIPAGGDGGARRVGSGCLILRAAQVWLHPSLRARSTQPSPCDFFLSRLPKASSGLELVIAPLFTSLWFLYTLRTPLSIVPPRNLL
jgi:hypothetical protein